MKGVAIASAAATLLLCAVVVNHYSRPTELLEVGLPRVPPLLPPPFATVCGCGGVPCAGWEKW